MIAVFPPNGGKKQNPAYFTVVVFFIVRNVKYAMLPRLAGDVFFKVKDE